MSKDTMKDIDHSSPSADELTSIWYRGDEDRSATTENAAELDEQIVPSPADD
ncbi:hypothetical protein [Halalkalicoccus subterraneus]|uniref:hypothetical protein n=1 Tax=Halalkalicoccus subterraneus TaxID=2675002 RepID=UPI0013CEAFBF|nr:hypothetical protein [Halalkalicoccus subterraneus]